MEQFIIILLAIAMSSPNSVLPANNWRVAEFQPDRIGFQIMNVSSHPKNIRALEHLSVFSFSLEKINPDKDNQPENNLMRVLEDIFRNEGVPCSLAWMAQVESGLNPEAVSSVGAVGLFQLMPSTAERFGLKIFPVDERKDPDKSARAAALYLRQLHKEFGEWGLALAAYNAGEGRVRRTLREQKTRTCLEVLPHLPAETRKYVPRVMAIAALREDQKRGVAAAFYAP